MEAQQEEQFKEEKTRGNVHLSNLQLSVFFNELSNNLMIKFSLTFFFVISEKLHPQLCSYKPMQEDN